MLLRTGVIAAAISLSAAPVMAQNALGDGRALDNNLQSGSNTNPSANQPNYAARNNLITGNAPGLSGFKGNVGYRAPGDFQGRLGSDNLFQFHTRSLPAGQTAPWRIDYGRLPVFRSMAPTSARDIATGKINSLISRDAARAGNPIYNLPTSTSGPRTTDTLGSGGSQSIERSLQLDASPLLGLRLEPRSSAEPQAPNHAPDALERERAGGPPQSLMQRLEALDHRADKTETQTAERESDVYYELLQRVRENRVAEADAAAAQKARGLEPALATDVPPAATPANLDGFARLIEYKSAALSTLAGDSDAFVDQKLRSAEANLQSGRYFDAEHDYRAVLQLQPGHPMARVGLVHAQLGVGMILTAGHNLRELFTRHPELIAARYDTQLLPDIERLKWARKQLETMLARNKRRLEPAILLAYLHYQASRLGPMRAALDEAKRRAPEDSLPKLLSMVWEKQTDRSAR